MKTKIKYLSLLISFCFCVSLLTAQEFDIYYNLSSDEITYFKNGEEVQNPRIRKGHSVKLHVTEYNPYLYDLEVDFVEKNANEPASGMMGGAGQSAGFGSFLNSFGMFDFGGGGLDFGGGMPLLDMPLLTINDNPITLQGLFSKSRGSAEVMTSANEAMAEISLLMESTQLTYKGIGKIHKSVFVSKLALENVDKIKTHHNLKPSMIRELCKQYYELVFQTNAEETVSLEDMLYWKDVAGRYGLLVDELKEKQTKITKHNQFLQLYSDQLSTLDFDDVEYKKYVKDLLSFQKEAKEFESEFQQTIQKLPPTIESPGIDEMAELQIQLAEVVSNDFTYHTRIQPSKDEVEVTIKLSPKVQPEEMEEDDETVLERTFVLEARGGLKVNASLGAGFSQFFTPEEKFATRNGLIVSDETGQFNPSLASFLHFYSYGGKKTNVGGTFGVGFPVISGGDDFAFQFYLGPSLIIGSGQRLVLTAGLMGGKVDRLSKGYQIGDAFDTDIGDIPVSGKYEMGAFLGLSFNMGG